MKVGDAKTGMNALQVEEQGTATPLYDLQGRRMKAVPSKGIYVKDGRKRVVF